jgi:hypothetical protein
MIPSLFVLQIECGQLARRVLKRWARGCVRKRTGGTRNTFSLHEKLLKELIVSLVVDVRCNLLVVYAMEK